MSNPANPASSKYWMLDDPSNASDVLVNRDGKEFQVLIVEDTTTQMVVEIIETGERIRMEKHVQCNDICRYSRY